MEISKKTKKTSKNASKTDFFSNMEKGSQSVSKSEILDCIRVQCSKTGDAIGVKEIAVILGCDDSKVRKSLQKIRKTSYTGYDEKVKDQTLTSNDGKEKMRFVAGHGNQKEQGVLYAIWENK